MKTYFFAILVLNLIYKIQTQNETEIIKCDYGSILVGNTCEECGLTDNTPNVKIVGGVAAAQSSWPAQALVIQSYTTDYTFGSFGTKKLSIKFKCGGTLINKRTVLTAAHCVAKSFSTTQFGSEWRVPIAVNKYYPSFASMFKVYLGAHDISFIDKGTDPSAPAVEKAVSSVIIHPSFNDASLLNDITLLILSTPVTINSAIKFACLPSSQSISIPSSNQACYAAGWGTLSMGGKTPTLLNNVELTVYDKSKCSNVLPSTAKNWNSQLCAGDISGKKDTCQGDSGGGLYIYDSTVNKYIVAGVTSYGEGCAVYNKPGIYTRVSNYVDWITSNWEKNSSNRKISSNTTIMAIITIIWFLFI